MGNQVGDGYENLLTVIENVIVAQRRQEDY